MLEKTHSVLRLQRSVIRGRIPRRALGKAYLYLRHGRWGDRQVIPADWVTRSSTSYSQLDSYSAFGPQTGYGFLWWTEDWGYSALGAGGHVIAIVPGKDLVIVHRVAYDPPQEDFVAYRDVDTMIRMVIAAAPSVNPVN